LIQIRRGLEKDIGTLAVGELGYCTDTKKLYIGTESGNVLLVAAQTVGDMLKSIYDIDNDGKVDMAEMADNVPWSGIQNKPDAFPPVSHTHYHDQITQKSNADIANGVFIIDKALIDVVRANRTAFMPANAIEVEYTVDGGNTWIDYGLTDAQKEGLFSQNRGHTVFLGKGASQAIGNGVRITVKPLDRYTSIDMFYCWFNTNGATCVCTIERSTIGNKTSFTVIRDNVIVQGRPGNNEIYFSPGTFGGYENQTSNFYAYRFTFMITQISSSLITAPSVTDLRMYGTNVWTSANNMMRTGYIYSWDNSQNVTFPAKVAAVGGFGGNADTATKLATARKISLTGDISGSADFDGSRNVTIEATVANNSHSHSISNIDGLQDALNNKMKKGPLTWNDLMGV